MPFLSAMETRLRSLAVPGHVSFPEAFEASTTFGCCDSAATNICHCFALITKMILVAKDACPHGLRPYILSVLTLKLAVEMLGFLSLIGTGFVFVLSPLP